jgi:hypothetical protein
MRDGEGFRVASRGEILAEAFEMFGMCDAVHAVPAGVYLEEMTF